MWDPVVRELSGEFRIVTPDLPGHGTRAGEPFRLEVAVTAVRDAALALSPSPVVLAGDSLGGYVALAAAAAVGSQLRGAFLSGCTANFQGPAGWLHVAQVGLTHLFDPAKLHARLAERVAREYAAGPAVVEAGLRPAAFAEAVAELRRRDSRAELARLEVAVLLVNGIHDWPHRLGERRMLAAGP